MADDLVTAGININVNRNGGNVNVESDEATNVLKQILTAIKEGNRNQFVEGRKQESGFGIGNTAKGVFAGNALSSVAKTPQGLTALLTAVGLGSVAKLLTDFGGSDSKNPLTNYFDTLRDGPKNIINQVQDRSQFGFAAAQGPGGEDQFIKIDKKTGEILDILDEQGAENLGILDELGNVKNDWKATNVTQNAQLRELEMSRDKLVLTNEFIDTSLDNFRQQERLDGQIVAAKKAYRDKLRKLAGLSTGGDDGIRALTTDEINANQSFGGDGSNPNPISYIQFAETQRRQQQIADSMRNQSETSGSLYLDLLQSNTFGR